MADYDVGVLALQTPPAAAPLTTYRPALWVRNNGLRAAIASGTISAYKAGLLVYSSPVLSDPIAPGDTGLATASADWTPAVQGDYIWTAYVTTDRDQYEPNNNLGPTKITVGPPPPPPERRPQAAGETVVRAGHWDGGAVAREPGGRRKACIPRRGPGA